MKQLHKWINELKATDKVAVLHDRDADGVCSAILVMKALERLKLATPIRLNQKLSEKTITKETIEKLKKLGVTRLITTDLAIDQYPTTIKELEKSCKLLVFDHHKPTADISSENTTVIRSQDWTPKYCPTSALVLNLLDELAGCSGQEWIAAVGIIADGGQEQWQKILDFSIKTWQTNLEQLKKIADIIGCVSLHEDDTLIDKLCKTIYDADHPLEIAESTEYEQYVKNITDEIEKWFKLHEKKAELHKDILYYKIKPKYHINSPLSTKLWDVYPDKTVILVQDRGNDFVEISLRRQDGKVDVATLIQEAIKDFPEAKGGGHPRAAGARILRKNLEDFERRVLR